MRQRGATIALLESMPEQCPVLVGRERHLAALDRLLANTANGNGQGVLVTGPDGAGKSRLLVEVRARAVHLGIAVLCCACTPPQSSPPDAALRELFGAEMADSALSPAAAAALAQRAALPLDPDPATIRPDASLAPVVEQRRLLTVLLAALRARAAKGPLLLLLDDAHDADELLLEFVRLVALEVAALPILLLLATRDPTDALDSPLLTALAPLQAMTTLTLEPLTRHEIGALAAALLNAPTPLDERTLRLLQARSRGNPYAVEELLYALAAKDGAAPSDDAMTPPPPAAPEAKKARFAAEQPLPADTREAVRWRVERLSATARMALSLAAMIGLTCEAALLSELSALGIKAWRAALAELVGARLLATEGEGRVAFRHALTQRAVAELVSPEERPALHRAAAEGIERHGVTAPAISIFTVAGHYAAAADWPRALRSARQASHLAFRLSMPRAATAMLTTALAAAEALAQPDAALLNARGVAHQWLGDFERARQDYEAAIQVATTSEDRRTEWQSLLDLGDLWIGRDYARSGQFFERAQTVARALRDPAALTLSLNRLGFWHFTMDRPHEARGEHRKALVIAREGASPREMGEALLYVGLSTLLTGDAIQAAASLEQAITMLRTAGHQQLVAMSLATRALCGPSLHTELVVCVPAETLDGVRSGERAVQIARAGGWSDSEAYALICLASCLGQRGDYARAIATAEEALAVAEAGGHVQWITGALWTLATLQRSLMALAPARTSYTRALSLAREIGSRHWMHLIVGSFATGHIMQGEFAEAEALLESARVGEAPRSLGQRSIVCARVELALARGEPRLALETMDTLLARGASGSADRPIPRVARLRCDALAALGRHAEAEAVLRVARQEAAQQSMRSAQWYLGVALARLLHSQRREAEAARAAQSARGMIEMLAEHAPDPAVAGGFRQRALAMLPPSTSPAERRALKVAFDGLTTREREVAALIAQGKSNRAIAEALVVSERTAETHVGNILNKLGFSSRAQIAAWTAAKLRAIHDE